MASNTLKEPNVTPHQASSQAPDQALDQAVDAQPAQAHSVARQADDVEADDIWFIYLNTPPRWLSDVLARLRTRGWEARAIEQADLEVTQRDDDPIPARVTLTLSVDPRVATWGGLHYHLSSDDQLDAKDHPPQLVEPELKPITPAQRAQIARVSTLAERLLETSMSFTQTPDPRLNRTRRALIEELSAVFSKFPYVPASSMSDVSELIYVICDLVSEALCADLAYSQQQPELALQMHVELHRALSREVSLRYDAVMVNAEEAEVERSVWRRLTQLLLVRPGDVLNTHEVSSFEYTDTALSEEEVGALDQLLYRLESESARDTKTLLNHYRVRWEQLLIARHSARILRAFDQRFDELIGRADSETLYQPLCEVELAHLMMMIDDKIGAVMQSGYLKGALEIYRYISRRLDDHERLSSAGSDFDPSAVASVLHMLIDQLRALDAHSDRQQITSSTDVILQLDQMRSAVHQFIESAIPYCYD